MTNEEDHLAHLLRCLEEALTQPEVRGDADRVAALLHDNFAEIGKSGRVYDKASVIRKLQLEAANQQIAYVAPSVHDFELHPLSADIALVNYRCVSRGPDSSEEVLRSSIWQCIDGAWRIRFHQGTPAQVPQPRGT